MHKKYLKRIIAVAAAACMVTSLTACGNSKGSADGEDTASADHSDQTYILVGALTSDGFFIDHKIGLEAAGEDLGVKVKAVGPADQDMSAMVDAFDQAIAEKPTGILTIGFDESLNTEVKKAMDAGIPVVTVDADLEDSGRICFVGTGNYSYGLTGGEHMAQLLNGEGQVAILTKPGQPNLEDRQRGFEDALANYPGIEVVQVSNDNQDVTKATQAASELLQKYPDLDAILCTNASGSVGAATAVREAGKQGDVKILANDRNDDVVQLIQDGVITSTVAQRTALMSYYGVQILYNYVNNPVQITTDNEAADFICAPQNLDTGSVIVDSSNAQYWFRDTSAAK